jgi:hypothetical protein
MTDVRLRDAERRALSGSVDDQTRALTERLRAGTLTRERLELAAFCGHQAAAAGLQPFADDPYVASGEPTACTPCVAESRRNYTFADDGSWWCLKHAHEHHDLKLWLRGLSRWADVGPAPGWVLVLASVAAARVALPYAERGLVHRDGRPVADDQTFLAPRRAIQAAEAWLACPCEEHERAVVSAGGGSPGSRITFYEGPAILLRSWGIKEQWEQAVFRASELAGESPVLNAIRSSLIEWSLGGEK